MADDSLLNWVASVGSKHKFVSGAEAQQGDAEAGAGMSPKEKQKILEELKQMDKELDQILAAVTER